MPPHPQPHDPALDTHERGAATSATVYRACVANVQPDDVLRNVRRCNGVRSWSLAPREVYQIADCTVTVYEQHHERAPALVLDGPDEEQIRSILSRLGLQGDPVINQLQQDEDS